MHHLILILLLAGELLDAQISPVQPRGDDARLTPELPRAAEDWRPSPVVDPEGPYAYWTGENPSGFGALTGTTFIIDDIPRLFEDAWLHYLSTRDVESAVAQFDVAKLLLSRAPLWGELHDEDHVSLLLELAAARSRFHLQLGEYELARLALDEPLFRPGEIAARCGEGSEVLLAAVGPWEAASTNLAPQLQELVLAVEAGLQSRRETSVPLDVLEPDALAFLLERFGEPSPALDEQVAALLVEGAWDSLTQLGVRAAPSLALRVLANLEDALPLEASADKYRVDPLHALIACDFRAGMLLIDAWADRGGSNWRRRILDGLSDLVRWNDLDLWRQSESTTHDLEPTYPGLLRAIEALVNDPRTLESSLWTARAMAGLDALSPTLQATLGRVVRGLDEEVALRVLSSLRTPGAECLVGIYLDALESPHDEVRRTAAEMLSTYGQVDAWLDRVEDPDTRVRRHLLSSLAPHGFDKVSLRARVTSERIVVSVGDGYPNRDLTDAAQIAFEAFLRDPDPDLRASATSMLVDGSRASDVLFRTALADEAPQVREAAVTALDLERFHPLVAELAAGEDRELLRALDKRLVFGWVDLSAQAALAILGARRANEAVPMHLPSTTLDERSQNWAKGALPALAPWLAMALEQDRDDLVDFFLELLDQVRGRGQLQISAFPTFDRFLTDEEWVALARRSDAVVAWVGTCAHGGSKDARLLSVRFSTEPLDTIWVRGQALAVGHVLRTEAELDALHHLLRDFGEQGVPQQEALSFMGGQLKVEPSVVAEFFVELSEDPAVARPYLSQLAREFEHGAELTDAAATRIIQMASEPGLAVPHGLTEALVHMMQSDQREWALEQAGVLIEHTSTLEDALLALLRDNPARHVARFAQVLGRRDTTTQIQTAAITGLRAAGTPDAEAVLRSSLVKVDTIARTHLEEAISAFERQRELLVEGSAPRGLSSEAEAIAQLVEMLGSENAVVRREAARGLAAFGAPEAIPLLIPLLEDSESQVREAAAAALERLNDDSGADG